MKHGIICTMLLFMAFSCHSTRRLDHRVENTSTDAKEIAIARTDSTGIKQETKDSTATSVTVSEFIRITNYNDSGGVSSIQEQWRQTGTSNVAVSTGRSSTVSVSDEKKHIEEKTTTETKAIVKENTSTDSRPVQGLEWIWFVIGGVLIVAIIILVKSFKP